MFKSKYENDNHILSQESIWHRDFRSEFHS